MRVGELVVGVQSPLRSPSSRVFSSERGRREAGEVEVYQGFEKWRRDRKDPLADRCRGAEEGERYSKDLGPWQRRLKQMECHDTLLQQSRATH